MATPQDYRWVVNLGMGIVTVLFALLGILGYLFCQEECKGSITLNLPKEGYVYTMSARPKYEYTALAKGVLQFVGKPRENRGNRKNGGAGIDGKEVKLFATIS